MGAGAFITKNVPDYALMAGVPAKQTSWISRGGVKLPKPDSDGIMICPESGYRYKIDGKGILKCLDLDEDKPLPKELAVGEKSYSEFRKKD